MEYGLSVQDDYQSLVSYNRHVKKSADRPSWAERMKKLRAFTCTVASSVGRLVGSVRSSVANTSKWQRA